MTQSLKATTIRGVSWSFLDSISNQGITFLVGLVLARLLTPEDYSLLGIILIFISVFNSIVDSGFSSALIRKTDATDRDYNTAFFSNLGISVVLCTALFLLAPVIADFFSRPTLTDLLRVMSFIIIINAFVLIQRTILMKRIDFKTQTKVSLISSVSSGVVGIGMAIAGFGVWALVGQQLSRQGLNAVALWIYAKWHPKFQFSVKSFKELFGFGWKLLISGLIDTVWREIYQVVIGKCYAPATLGQYTRAQQFGSIFSSNLTAVVQRVSYPVLSTIQDDKVRLKAAYKRIIKITMLPTLVLMLGMAGCARSMIQVLVGNQWLPAVPFLQIICFQMMLYPLHALNLNMLQVEGRSDLFLRLEIIKKAIAVGPVLLGIFVGIYWMLVGSVFTGIISYYLNALYSGPAIDYTIKEQIKDILPSFGIAMVMCAVVLAMSFIPVSPFILFPLQFISGMAIAIALSKKIELPEYIEIEDIVKRFIAKKIKNDIWKTDRLL